MDDGKLSLCGEESFGTGSDHIREKDGIWATLAWLSIVASRQQEGKPFVTLQQIVEEHWAKFGRNFFSRFDYEGVSSESGDELVAHLRSFIADSKNIGRSFNGYTIKSMDDFEYVDPVDASVSRRQGIRFIFDDGSRIVFRLSGTGSSGATVRVYFDQYSTDPHQFNQPTQVALGNLIATALEISNLERITGRNAPTVIT
jgi:phosphoglucomutase